MGAAQELAERQEQSTASAMMELQLKYLIAGALIIALSMYDPSDSLVPDDWAGYRNVKR